MPLDIASEVSFFKFTWTYLTDFDVFHHKICLIASISFFDDVAFLHLNQSEIRNGDKQLPLDSHNKNVCAFF